MAGVPGKWVAALKTVFEDEEIEIDAGHGLQLQSLWIIPTAAVS